MDQYLEASLSRRSSCQFEHIRLFGDVRRKSGCLQAFTGQLGCRIVNRLLTDIRDQQAKVTKAAGTGEADVSGCAGDDGQWPRFSGWHQTQDPG
jgi:hypothetical protein